LNCDLLALGTRAILFLFDIWRDVVKDFLRLPVSWGAACAGGKLDNSSGRYSNRNFGAYGVRAGGGRTPQRDRAVNIIAHAGYGYEQAFGTQPGRQRNTYKRKTLRKAWKEEGGKAGSGAIRAGHD